MVTIAFFIVSFGTVLIEIIINGNWFVLFSYGLLIPILFILPRLIFSLSKGMKKLVSRKWVFKIEKLSFISLAINVPGTLFLHDLAFQYDRYLHLAMGFIVPLILLLIFAPIFRARGFDLMAKHRVFFLIFAVTFVGLFAFEGFQFLSDKYLGTKLFFDVAQDIMVDFWEDIIFGTLGLIIAMFYIKYTYEKLINV